MCRRADLEKRYRKYAEDAEDNRSFFAKAAKEIYSNTAGAKSWISNSGLRTQCCILFLPALETLDNQSES